MLRDVAEPGDSGGLEGDGGVQTAGNCAVDYGLFLLAEQRDHLFLRPDRSLEPSIGPVQKPDNCNLLVGRRERDSDALNCSM